MHNVIDTLASGKWVTSERVTRFAVVCGLLSFGMLALLVLTATGTLDAFGRPLGTDFSVIWNAGRMANGGHALEAWNPDALNAAARTFHGGRIDESAWLYPPVFLIVAAALALLPYTVALMTWQAVSLAALGLALQAFLKHRRAVVIALSTPLTAIVLGHGQNAYLTASLLGGGLALLDRKPLAAGFLLGPLVYKPQLALLIGPFLLLQRCWRPIVGALVSILLFCALSLALWGPDAWAAFVHSLSIGRGYMEEGAVGYWKSASLFAAAKMLGASTWLAYAVQAAGGLFALWSIWKLRHAPLLVRCAGLCAGTALATPYLLDYDLAVVSLGGAFLYAASQTDFLRWERTALALLWMIPLFVRPIALATHLALGPALALILALLVLRRSGAPTLYVSQWGATRPSIA